MPFINIPVLDIKKCQPEMWKAIAAHFRLNLATANLEEVLSASKYHGKKQSRGSAKDFNEN